MIHESNHPTTGEARATDIPGAFYKNEKLLVALLESASQAIISIDRAGRIVLVNRRTAELEIQRITEMISRKAAQSSLTRPPAVAAVPSS